MHKTFCDKVIKVETLLDAKITYYDSKISGVETIYQLLTQGTEGRIPRLEKKIWELEQMIGKIEESIETFSTGVKDVKNEAKSLWKKIGLATIVIVVTQVITSIL